MKRFISYCTEEQTKRAIELGAPINKQEVLTDGHMFFDYATNRNWLIPTTQQMIGWLREKGIIVFVHKLDEKYEWVVESNYGLDRGEETSYEQAELAAIEKALNYLEKGK